MATNVNEEQLRAAIAANRAQWNERLQQIRNDQRLSEQGKIEKLKAGYAQTLQNHQALIEAWEQVIENERQRLHSALFSIGPGEVPSLCHDVPG